MNMKLSLEVSCSGCGSEDVYWWEEDETEDTMEVYTECDNCYRGDKRFVSKSDDTSRDRLKEIARKIA